RLTPRVWLTVGLLCCTASAAAQDVAFEAAVRTGIGIPLGKVSDDGTDLNDIASLQIPLQLDVGVRLASNWFVGAYFQYGFGIVSDDATFCDDDDLLDIDCSASDVRLGIQAHYHFSPRQSLDPWLGLGFGYEWATLSAEGGNLEISSSVSGFEFVSFQFGIDFEVSRHVRLGPFLSFSLAQFDESSVECDGANVCSNVGVSGDIEDKALHEWLMLGVRVAFGT
ncbi:MAG TPA: outer membrane beta-barrel protein, partial [Polyangiales bacterium]|nr:outer membrane beta-barrel protein [Polyangiales bacterium]